jgi:HPt (histidine-containing phosphotransfer) domain-containing protein
VAEVPEDDPVEPVLSPTMAGQIANGGGFGLQHLIVTFLRETPARIADLVSLAARPDQARLGEGLASVDRLATLAGAERLAVLARRAARAAGDGAAEVAVGRLGKIEQAFLEVRELVTALAPPSMSLDAELPSVNGTFLDQLAPERDGAARTLATKLADTFRTDAPNRLADLSQAVEREDCDAGQRVAQTLKGMCGLIGADPMAKLCALIEADARLKRIGQSQRNVEQLALELERVLATLARPRGDRV